MALLLRDLPSGPLLTAEQEHALARRIRGEDTVVPPPGKARPSAREARDRLVEQNIPLVVSVARGYRGRGVGVEDLVQEGALALQKAAERFDPCYGNRFATYAMWWVREAMVRATQEAWSVSLPQAVRARVAKIVSTEQDMRAQLGRNPSAAEIGERVGLAAEQVEHARQLTSQAASLDTPDGDEAGSLAERLAEPGPSPETEVERRALRADVLDALTALAPDERRVLALRYGIGQPRAYSPEEIESLTGLSKHRRQRLEIRALARLRANQAKRLRPYV